MASSLFMNAQEVANVLGSFKAYAYNLIKKLNEELSSNGYITVQGKINRNYFNEKIYGGYGALNDSSQR